MRRRAVLTGGAGFVGSHLAERLLAQDIDVICLDNFVTGAAANVAHLQDREGFRLLKHDVAEHISIDGPVDYVLHFASPASPVDYAELPIESLKAGSLGTLHTLGLAKKKGARYLLASTSESYGDPLVHPQPESYWGNVNPVGPRACYDEAKRFAEALTTSYRTKHGVNTAIMRIFNTYGPRMRPNDGRAVPNFITQALSGDPITVQGDGTQTRSVCHVDDLVEGALRLLFSDLPGPVNVGNPYEMTILELANLVCELTGTDSPLEFIERAQDDPSQRQPDITLARTKLRWEPKVDVRAGLLETIAWFRDQAQGASRVTHTPLEIKQALPRHNVAVIGTGYVGAVTSTCLAFLGHSVCGLDTDSLRAGQLNNGQVPFFSAWERRRLPMARRTSHSWRMQSNRWRHTCALKRSSSTSRQCLSARATGRARFWKTRLKAIASCPSMSFLIRSSFAKVRLSTTSFIRIASCWEAPLRTSAVSRSSTSRYSSNRSMVAGEIFGHL
jgi:UDPglucose 6-dehydrogenase